MGGSESSTFGHVGWSPFLTRIQVNARISKFSDLTEDVGNGTLLYRPQKQWINHLGRFFCAFEFNMSEGFIFLSARFQLRSVLWATLFGHR